MQCGIFQMKFMEIIHDLFYFYLFSYMPNIYISICVNHAGFDDVKNNLLDVSVWIPNFDDVKEESNKVALKDKHCINTV